MTTGPLTAFCRMLYRGRIDVLDRHHDPGSPNSLTPLDSDRAIFFHVPKTAGLSIAYALWGGPVASHIDVATAWKLWGPIAFRRYFKFAFVRHPLDRLVSAYTYLRAGALDRTISPFIARYIAPYPTFQVFVRYGLERVLFDLHFRPQVEWLCDRRGRLAVDYVGRFERLAADFRTVATRLGRPDVELGHRNPSDRRADYRSYYDEPTRRHAARIYAADLDRFGYTLDERC